MIVGLVCDPHCVELAKQVLNDEIDKLAGEGFTDRELVEAQKNVKLNYMFNVSTNSGKASELSFNEVIGRGFAFGEKYVDLVSSVTREQINEVLQNSFFNKGQYVDVVVEP